VGGLAHRLATMVGRQAAYAYRWTSHLPVVSPEGRVFGRPGSRQALNRAYPKVAMRTASNSRWSGYAGTISIEAVRSAAAADLTTSNRGPRRAAGNGARTMTHATFPANDPERAPLPYHRRWHGFRGEPWPGS